MLNNNNLTTQFLAKLIHLPMLILITFPGFLVWSSLPSFIEKNVTENAINYATSTGSQFKALRGYYTKNIITKVLNKTSLQVSHNHQTDENTIPLPATMIHDLNEKFSNSKIKLSLYSIFPFPNRKDRTLDSFQLDAWENISSGNQNSYVKIERQNNQSIVRVAIPDKMVNLTCVTCHNNHPDTPKVGWKIGDTRGILETNINITDQVNAGKTLSNILFFMIITLSFLIWLISNLIHRIQN
jgi:methyl-accepting chemotaxis protein